MGVAVVVLFSLRQLDAEAAVPMLGLGLACLAAAQLGRQNHLNVPPCSILYSLHKKALPA